MTRAIMGLLAVALSTGFWAASFATPTTHDAHGAHGAHQGAVKAPGGRLWPTDAPLRAGMSRIEVAVEQASAKERPISQERARELARVVEDNVNYIIKNCKLAPEPDAALHVLIGRMLTAANQLKDEASSDAGVTSLVGVLRDYRGAFDHTPAAAGA